MSPARGGGTQGSCVGVPRGPSPVLKTIPPMLETVTKGFRAARNRLAGKQEITPELVDESLRDIRVSLLEADVAFDVVKKFVARVREKAVGEVVQTSITDKSGRKMKVSPGDHFVKICHD